MATYNKYPAAVEALAEAINSGSAQWAIALSNTINSGDTTFVAGTTDLATGGGYTQGGANVTTTSAAQSAGIYKLVLADPATWTATGGGFTFRYAILVEKTNNIPVAYWDYGSSQIVAVGEQVVADLDATNGVFTIQ